MNRLEIRGDLDLRRRPVRVVQHTEQRSGRPDRHSVELAIGLGREAQLSVEPDDLDGVIDDLSDARKWLRERR